MAVWSSTRSSIFTAACSTCIIVSKRRGEWNDDRFSWNIFMPKTCRRCFCRFLSAAFKRCIGQVIYLCKRWDASQEQLLYLQSEGKEDDSINITDLLNNFNNQVDKAIDQLKKTNECTLTEIRAIGRKQILSTVSLSTSLISSFYKLATFENFKKIFKEN